MKEETVPFIKIIASNLNNAHPLVEVNGIQKYSTMKISIGIELICGDMNVLDEINITLIKIIHKVRKLI